MNYSPLARTADLVVQGSGSETLTFDIRTNKACCLNETSALIWKLCNGKRRVSEISDEMTKQLKIRFDEDLVWFALEELDRNDLLEKRPSQYGRFSRISRREVVKRLGIGGMALLPIVSSIVAPTAVSAQSNACPVSPCFLPNQVAVCPQQCGNQIKELRSYTSTGGSCTGTETVLGQFNCGAGGGVISLTDTRIF
ncbi:MAG: PqqD family protein [Pyrinomonadaceae bacterium]